MTFLWQWYALGLCVLAVGGCGRAENSQVFPAKRVSQVTAAVTSMPAEEADVQAAGDLPAASLSRKIVFHAEVDMVCDDFPAVAARLELLATASGGFIADAYLVGAAGQPRQGEWKVRVPSGRFDDLLAGVKKLAEVRTARTTSDDVSAEFYDVEARIRNHQQEEARLLRLLDDRTAKLEEVLSVEREVSRVRGEVEQMQARLRVLTNLTDLATITVRLEEAHGYLPETAASFPLRLTRGVRRSYEALLVTVQMAIVVLAMSMPWILALAVPLALSRIIRRRWRLRGAANRAI
jgi:hypothetical protein